jgi:hypothetical protein
MKAATVFFPQTFPLEVAGGGLRSGSSLRVKRETER